MYITGFLMVELTGYDLSAKMITAKYLGDLTTCDQVNVGLATVKLSDGNDSRYDISFIETIQNGDGQWEWRYRVRVMYGDPPTNWGLKIPSCISDKVVDTGEGSFNGDFLSWNLDDAIVGEEYEFVFVLDDQYGNASVGVAVNTHEDPYGSPAVTITGPNCDILADEVDTGGDDGTGTSLAVCLPPLDFETDDAGGSLVSGQIVDNEWAAWGVHVTTSSPASHPAMVFDSASPTGNDPDLGTPNQDFSGPGVGVGGKLNEPGENGAAHGKLLIISEDNNPANPDDNGGGGTVVFTFDVGVRMDEVHVVDVADVARAGTVRAYSDPVGSSLLVQSKMLGLGENSMQTVPVNATGVRRLEIDFPGSGGIPAVVSCRNQQTDLYNIGDIIWDDADGDGLQDENEPGVADVEIELLMEGQGQVVAKAATNGRGLYRFENLPGGTYVLRIAASNFDSGGALEDSVLTGRNVGEDTLDSDFDSSTMTVTTTVPFNGGDNLTLDGGVLLAAAGDTAAPDRVTVTLRDSRSSRVRSSSGRAVWQDMDLRSA